MKGATIDSSNTTSFGSISNLNGAGYYEINYVKSIAGNRIFLVNTFLHVYDLDGNVQFIRVPYYKSARVTTPLTAKTWDGTTGGVLAFMVKDTLQLQSDIDLSGQGFHGGSGKNKLMDGIGCDQTDFYVSPSTIYGAEKGEGFTQISFDKSGGRGPLANGGGGADNHNSGGGGGGNGGKGGAGGNQFEDCGGNPFVNGGLGGFSGAYSNIENRIFMGGGGGGGHANNPTGGFNADGGAGGGIILLTAKTFDANGHTIYSRGKDANQCVLDLGNPRLCTEGTGGGGAGGTVVMDVQRFLSATTVDVGGGKGADMPLPNGKLHGPGGGGSGGVAWITGGSKPGLLTVNTSGGNNGVNITTGDPWGSTPGQAGPTLLNLALAYATPVFKKNIDSVGISKALTGCNTISFSGISYTNTTSITNWEWFYGDGDSEKGPFVKHTYVLPGTYTVKVVGSDVNGCKDSTTTKVTLTSTTVDAGKDTTVCTSAPFQLHGIGGITFAWTPAQYLNDSTLANPVANINADTKFYLYSTGPNLCTNKDSITIAVRPPPVFSINDNQFACLQTPAPLQAKGGNIYAWSPGASLTDSTISNPLATPQKNTAYTAIIKDTACGISDTLHTNVYVLPLPSVQASSSNDLDCVNYSTALTASGAFLYSWKPKAGLSDPEIANPVASPLVNTVYVVKGLASNGCSATDSVTVNVNYTGKAVLYMPDSFTPNGDGINDCYGVKYLAPPEKFELSIFNRFGQQVYHSTNVSECWNGMFNDKRQETGAFIYYLKAKTVCGKVEKKGTIVLLR